MCRKFQPVRLIVAFTFSLQWDSHSNLYNNAWIFSIFKFWILKSLYWSTISITPSLLSQELMEGRMVRDLMTLLLRFLSLTFGEIVGTTIKLINTEWNSYLKIQYDLFNFSYKLVLNAHETINASGGHKRESVLRTFAYLHNRERELIPTSSSLTTTFAPWHVYTYPA